MSVVDLRIGCMGVDKHLLAFVAYPGRSDRRSLMSQLSVSDDCCGDNSRGSDLFQFVCTI